MIAIATRRRAFRRHSLGAGAKPSRRFAAWLALFGLLLQWLATLAPMPAAAMPGYGPWSPDQICLAAVGGDVPASQDGTDRNDLARHRACQLYLTQQLAGNFLAPATPLLALAAPAREPAIPTASFAPAPKSDFGGHSPRAPPATA